MNLKLLKIREEKEKLRQALREKAREEVRKKKLVEFQQKELQRLAPLQSLLKVGRMDIRLANSKY